MNNKLNVKLMETNSIIHRGRFIVQKIQEELSDMNNKLSNKHESLKNFKKFYIKTNNFSFTTPEFSQVYLFVYELNLKEWKLVDNIFQKKFNHEENLFNKIFKYFTINSDNDNIYVFKESKEL